MKNDNFKHMTIMVIGHLVPLILLLVLPKFGISNQWAVAFAIILMVVSHVLMMPSYSRHSNNKKNEKEVY